MPDITDPQIIKWSNERSRIIADKIEQLVWTALSYQADYAAQGIAAKIIAAGTSNNVGDGASADGRPIITGTMVQNLKAAVDKIITALNSDLVSGVGTTVKAITDSIQVNGSPR